MTLSNPPLDHAHLAYAASLQAQQIKSQLQRTHEMVRGLVTFVSEEHLSVDTFRAYWRQEERATLTLRVIGQSLKMDLSGVAESVYEQLKMSETMPLVDFQTSEAGYLFAMIDSVTPDEIALGDGRAAAEKLQYAVEARVALLRYTLSQLLQRYTPSFAEANFADTHLWLQAFSEMLGEAGEVIEGTQRLLWDEATAIQSYLDSLRRRFVMLGEQARTSGVIVRSDWEAVLEETEKKLLRLLEVRQEQLDKMALGNMETNQGGGWLESLAWQTARRAPLLGSLLLTVAGAGTLHAMDERPIVVPDLNITTSLRDTLDEVAGRARSFPVLARSSNVPDNAPRATDEIAQFFGMQPRPRGRQTLTISDSATFQRVLDELSHFGYSRREVLRLFGMNSVAEFSEPMKMDVRWGQGDRLLLLPPYEAVAAPAPLASDSHLVHAGAPLPLIAERFGFSMEQLLAANSGIADAASVTEGQVVELPVQSWTSQRTQDALLLSWGVSLEQIARSLSISAQTLAEINDIPNPESWMYTGQTLRLPAMPLLESEPEAIAAAMPAAPVAPLRFEGAAKPVNSLIVHRVGPGDTLDAVAQRYNTTVARLMEDNQLSGKSIEAGKTLLVRVSGRVVSVLDRAPTASRYDLETMQSGGTLAGNAQAATTGQYDSVPFQSGGSFPAALRTPLAIAPTLPDARDGAALTSKYGPTLFPSIDEMPEDARAYFTVTVQEVADFFNVRPGDIIGILQAENNNAGLRLHQPAVSSAGARGVGQVIARTWNGWANPATTSHITDLRSIEEHGGLGFDWSMREAWRAWVSGKSDGSELAHANADPDRFDNSVAAVARHLVHWGLTRERAASDPAWFQARLGDAISVYNSGRTLTEAENFTQSAANQKTTGQYVREAMAIAEATPLNLVQPIVSNPLRDEFRRVMDRTFGIWVSEEELARSVDGSAIAAQVQAGQLSPEQGAQQLLQQTLAEYQAQGQAARAQGQPLRWPYVYDAQTLAAQQLAVQYRGRTLNAWEVEDLVTQSGGSTEAMRKVLAQRADTRLFASALRSYDQLLKRSERSLPVGIHEVGDVMRVALAGYNPLTMDEQTMQAVMTRVEQMIRQQPEFQEVNRAEGFTATPLLPMPRLIKGFGVTVDYQVGGKHTGIDIANPLVNGQEPPIFAVGDGVVAYVGPLYCDAARACRGGNAIVIDHGDNLYSIYSHNSIATVKEGEEVQGGQQIGRQGNDGYSFGSHLHFEVHSGAPFSGDWQNPWRGGQFEDPMELLP